MKKILLCLALASVTGCTRAQNAAPQQAFSPGAADPAVVAPHAAVPPDAWAARKALYNFDQSRPLNIQWGSARDNLAAKITTLTYAGARGATVNAFYIAPQGGAPGGFREGAPDAVRMPAVVMLHGKDGRIEDMVPFGLLLAAKGYATIIPEVVGHGERNAGVPLFNPDPVKMRDGFIESVGDIRRSIDVLRTRSEIDSNRIGLVGVSMGAILGTLVSATDERVRTAVLIVGGGDWQTIFTQSQERFARSQRQKGALPPEAVSIGDDIDPKNFAAHIAPRPLLMISATRDTIIPPLSAKILFEAAAQPKKQIWVESGHLIPPAQAALPTFSWLQEHLRPTPQFTTARPEPATAPLAVLPTPKPALASSDR